MGADWMRGQRLGTSLGPRFGRVPALRWGWCRRQGAECGSARLLCCRPSYSIGTELPALKPDHVDIALQHAWGNRKWESRRTTANSDSSNFQLRQTRPKVCWLQGWRSDDVAPALHHKSYWLSAFFVSIFLFFLSNLTVLVYGRRHKCLIVLSGYL